MSNLSNYPPGVNDGNFDELAFGETYHQKKTCEVCYNALPDQHPDGYCDDCRPVVDEDEWQEEWSERTAKISFRAWDRQLHQMIYVIESISYGRAVMGGKPRAWPEYAHMPTLASWLNNPRFVVMQSTGLIDKHGKTIYELDVHEWDGKYFVVQFGDHLDDDLLDESYGWYITGIKDGLTSSLNYTTRDYVNIMSNVFEIDPDLLGGKYSG